MTRTPEEGGGEGGEAEDRKMPRMASIRQQIKMNHLKRQLVLSEHNLSFTH